MTDDVATPADKADTPDERLSEVIDLVADGLDLDIGFEVEPDEEGRLVAAIDGPGAATFTADEAVLLDAVELLGQVAARVVDQTARVRVDADGFRARRESGILEQADRSAAHVAQTGQPVALPPMRAADRRLVHRHLSERDELETHSDGREPERFIVVARRVAPPAAAGDD